MRHNFQVLFIFILIFSSFAEARLTKDEKDDLEHISIGADVFPYDWWLRIKSARAKDLNNNWDTKLKDGLDDRASVLYDVELSKYVSDVVGLSVTWSGHGSMNPEALRADPEMKLTQIGKKAPIRHINGIPSIRMLGVNCAACHTGNLKTDNGNYRITGGQSNFSIEWFLKDMMVSTITLLFNVDNQLAEFLTTFDYSEKDANDIAKKFKEVSLKELTTKTLLTLAAKQVKVIPKLPGHTFVKDEKAIADRLKALLRLTLHMKENESLGVELEKRMEFIAMLTAGTPKKTFEDGHWQKYKEVVAGYGRVDAFNSALNKLLREKKERVSLTAPVSYPPVWGIQNKYKIHYTGNTNSVTNRNIGLSMAAGSIYLDDKSNSTVNIHNLYKSEKLIYKIQSPNWQDVFQHEPSDDFRIKSSRVERGQVLYEKNCMSCHNPKKTHHEYKLPLYEYPILSHKKLGTDPNLSVNIVKPLKPLTNAESYPADKYSNTTQGLLEAFFLKYNIDKKTQDEYSFLEYRGKQWFKNTKRDNPDATYSARDLSGIWSTPPFLHNGSVPTLWDLLQKPEKRPTLFRAKDRYFDPLKVGFKNYQEKVKDCFPKNAYDNKTDSQQCVDTTISGSSNSGHNFGTNLSNEEKYDLIEYLKVIPPYSENVYRDPSSIDKKKAESQTPFLDEFDNVKLGKIILIGKFLERNDFLRHKLLTFKKWSSENPKQMFDELRNLRPIEFVSSMPIIKFGAKNSGLAIVSKNEDVFEVLENPSAFSARHVGFKLNPIGGHMLGTDLTEFNTIEKPWLRKLMPHTDYERVFDLIRDFTEKSFTHVEKKQQGAKTYKINLVNELGKKVPALLFEKYFGFSGDVLEDLYKWSYWIQLDTFRNPINRQSVRKKAVKIELDLLQKMNAHIAKVEKDLKKNGNKPINDTILERMILSDEVQKGIIKKDRIPMNMIGMLGASIDTIQIALLKSLEFFIENPTILKEAVAVAKTGDLETMKKYVMESLRLRPASPVLIRYAEKDQVIAKGTPREVTIPKGTSILLGTYSAMRDPDIISKPEEFDINRPKSSYLLFGHGHHKCLGDHLAEVELSIIMSAILQKTNIKYINNDKASLSIPEDRILQYDALEN